MTDYTELVDALRCGLMDGDKCESCKYLLKWDGRPVRCGFENLELDAAAAIEELQAEVDALKHDIARYAQMNTELLNEPKRGEMVEVVRCKDCVYYHKAHVKLDDGTELDYDSDVVKEYQQKRKESGDPFWEMVCADLGMNVGGRCERDNNQGYAEDKAVFRSETDFCSKARAKMEAQDG